MRPPLPHMRRGSRRARTAPWAVLVLAIGVALALGALAGLRPGSVSAQATERIDEQRAGIRQLEEELIRIDAEAGAAADATALAHARVVELRDAIRRTTADLERARVGHQDAQRRLGERLRSLYREQPPTFVEILVSSGSITGAVDAHETLDHIRKGDQQLVRGIRESRERLASSRRELLESRAESDRQLARAAGQAAELERLSGARRAVLDQARAGLERLLVEESVRQARLAALAQAEREAEAALLARAAAVPSSGPTGALGPAPSGATLEQIAQCESGGNPQAVSPGGDFRGKYQFHPDTWRALGGSGDPAAAPEAEQDRRAATLYAQRGSSPWPICGA